MISHINTNTEKINKQQLWLLKENATAHINQQKFLKKHLDFQKKKIFSLTLADCLSHYKIKFKFSNIDFDFTAVKVLQYKSLRSAMAAKYRVHKECFGQAMAIEDREDLTKEKRYSI